MSFFGVWGGVISVEGGFEGRDGLKGERGVVLKRIYYLYIIYNVEACQLFRNVGVIFF